MEIRTPHQMSEGSGISLGYSFSTCLANLYGPGQSQKPFGSILIAEHQALRVHAY